MNKNVLDSKPFSQEDYEAEPFFKEKEKIDNHIEKIKLQESKLDKEDFSSEDYEAKDTSWIDKLSEYGKTIAKGAIEGVSKLGSMISGPHREIPRFEEGVLQPTEGGLEQQSQTLDYLLPTENEDFGQRSIRRGLKEGPTMASFPGAPAAGTLGRSLGAGILGEGAKSLKLPEWAQSAAELTAYVGPDITKKLLTSGKNKEIIKFAKEMGMTDEQISPLLQSEFKQKWLSKLTSKKGRTEEALKSTKEALGKAYEGIKTSKLAKGEISEIHNGKLINGIKNSLKEMPREIQEKVEKDLADLLNNKITGESLMNFYKDLNATVGGNSKQLTLLKKPIKEALHSISPELAKNFENVNLLYTKFYPISSRLKPSIVSELVSQGEIIGTVGALSSAVMGVTQPLVPLVGIKSAKLFARELLINPHLQQLGEKMMLAMNQQKYGLVKKLVDSYGNKIKKKFPEISEYFENITLEEIKKLFPSQSKEQPEK